MGFKKTANLDVLGVSNSSRGSWKKVSSRKISSFFMDGGSNIELETALDTVADSYLISRNPEDYILIPLRANSADRPNENGDAFFHEELLRFDPNIGRRVYKTYDLKPHFVNHNSEIFKRARGVILDSHYNDENPASDEVKKIIAEAIGVVPEKDEFVEILVAMDTSKDPILAEAYRKGSVKKFSMGCDVESTKCSIPDCENVATSSWQFCKHVLGKRSKLPVKCADGKYRIPFEWCQGTIFAEISCVDDPADKTAEIQEGILSIGEVRRMMSSRKLSSRDLNELVSFVVNNHSIIPNSLAGVLDDILSGHA